jgi:hypothetical protein
MIEVKLTETQEKKYNDWKKLFGSELPNWNDGWAFWVGNYVYFNRRGNTRNILER